MNTFIIAFRESLEASLIIGIIYTLLHKKSLTNHIKFLWLGLITAIASSVLIAFLLKMLSNITDNSSLDKLFEGCFMILTSFFVFYVIFWLSKQVSSTNELKNKAINATNNKWGVFWLVFFTVIREGFETVIMLFPSNSIENGSYFYLKFITGITLAVLIGYLIFVKGKTINIAKFFKISSLFLVLFAAGMVAYGVHEIEEYVVKSNYISSFACENEIPRVWDILQPIDNLPDDANTSFYTYNENKKQFIHILHDKGSIGSFMKSFIGYNSNPNWIEFILWFLSLVFGIYLWRKN